MQVGEVSRQTFVSLGESCDCSRPRVIRRVRACQQGQFLVVHEVVEWPDGTVTVQYGFGHALYHAVVYGLLGLAQRVRLHRLLGDIRVSNFCYPFGRASLARKLQLQRRFDTCRGIYEGINAGTVGRLADADGPPLRCRISMPRLMSNT